MGVVWSGSRDPFLAPNHIFGIDKASHFTDGHFCRLKPCVHLPRWFASMMVRWRRNMWCRLQHHWYEVGSSQLRSSWHQQDWIYESLLMTRTALHARCVIVAPSATTVYESKNHASDWIKRGSCWKCSSGWQAICLRNSGRTFQLIQSVARVSQR